MNIEKPFFYKFCKKMFSKLFLWYYNPTIIGKENIINDGPVIYAGNHKHYFDPCFPIISSNICIHYMVKEEYFENKYIGWFFKKLGCIGIYKNKKENISSIRTAIKILKSNGAIGIFPEGTRNKDENKVLLDFKPGVVSLAQKTDSYIVPVGITGKYKFKSKNLIIRYGKPFKISDLEKEKADLKLYEEIKVLIK